MNTNTWRKTVSADIMTMTRTPRERLRWITLILAVYVVRVTDDPSADIAAVIEQFHDDWRACAMRSGKIKRGTRWAGVIEIDLVHRQMMGSQTKQDLIGALAGIDPGTLTHEQRVIVVHTHMVVDAKGHVTPDRFVGDMRKFWPGPRPVHSAEIWEERTVRENLERLASYSTKLWESYSEAWEGRPTRRLMDYEHEWKAWMRRLRDAVGLDNMRISSVTSRATECPLATPKTLTNKGVEPITEGNQLRTLIDHQENPQYPQNHTQPIMERQTMRMCEILKTDPIPDKYIDLDRISADMLRDLQRSFLRSGRSVVRTPELLQAMYSHEDDDRRDQLELDLLALDAEVRRAEISATKADADKGRADAVRSSAKALIDLGKSNGT